MSKLLAKWLKVYEDEIGLFFWTAILFFVISVSDILLNNFGETTFLKRYGVEYLPIIYMVNAVSTFVIMGFLTGVMARTASGNLLFYFLLCCGLSIGCLRLVIPLGFDLIYPVLYILKSQYEVLLGLLFWDMANDLFNTRQSKRLFPLLTAGGVMGSMLGSFSTPSLARLISIDNVMWVYLGTCIVGALIVRRMGSLFPVLAAPAEKKSKKKSRFAVVEEFRKVIPITRESTLVKVLIVLTLVPNMVIPILNFMFNFAVDQAFGTEGLMLKFFGYFRGSMNIVSFVVLLFVGRIYGKWGLPIALMFHPINYVIAFLAYLFRFDVYSAVYSQLSTSVLRRTINNPARSVLMGLFPPEHRSVVRPFLRGTVVRIGILLGSGAIMISQGLMHPRYISIVALIFVSLWIFSTIVLKRKYSQILLDLVSRNLLDLKSLEDQDVGQIFLDKKVQAQLVENFLRSRGKTCLWYAQLIKSLGVKDLDTHILSLIREQDPRTVVGLLGLLSENAGERAIPLFIELVKRRQPEITIAVLKAAARMPSQVSGRFLRKVFETATHPEIRAYAVVGLCREDPDECKSVIDSWLSSQALIQRKAGIISAGGSGLGEYVPALLDILQKEKDPELTALTLEALLLLKSADLNTLAAPFLKHSSEPVRRSALDAINVSDDEALRTVIPLMGDPSDAVRDQAVSKLQEAPHQNGELLIESLVIPNRRLKEGIFSLLESLQIRDVDVLRFAKSHFDRAYTNVAELVALERLEESTEKRLLADHLAQRKRERVETVLRVLSAQDRAGRMRVIHRGIFSADARQRANALEALEDTLGSNLSKAMVPLLEDISPSQCLELGRPFVKLPRFDSKPKALCAHLLAKRDWVAVVLCLYLLERQGLDGLERETLEPLLNSPNPYVREGAAKLVSRSPSDSDRKESAMETGISIPDKILHLRSIHIFEGLAVSELAAIASVTEEVVYPQGAEIIREGETGDTMYMIIEGRVAVIKGEEGTQLVLDHIQAGDYFGEMALFEDLVRSATIRSETETRVLVLDKREFTEIVREYPLIAMQICKVLSQRLRRLHEKLQGHDAGSDRSEEDTPPTKH